MSNTNDMLFIKGMPEGYEYCKNGHLIHHTSFLCSVCGKSIMELSGISMKKAQDDMMEVTYSFRIDPHGWNPKDMGVVKENK